MKKLFQIVLIFFVSIYVDAQQKPNIIYILADDMGYGDVSSLNKEAKLATPNIDKLIKESMLFTDAHSGSAVCTPTRYGILTGRYAWRSTLKAGVLGLYAPPLIDEGKMTVGKLLQQQGYATATIGKWHLGWDWPLKNGSLIQDSLYKGHNDEKVRIELAKQINFAGNILHGPTERGFNYYFGTDVPNYPPYGFIENDKMVHLPDMEKPEEMYGHPGPMVTGWRLENIMPSITNKAVEYINEKAVDKKNKQPFFLYMPLTAPHTPIAPDDDFKGKSNAGFYGDYVQQVDFTVGEIMKALQKSGLASNTLLIFTSDNGSPGRDGTGMSGELSSVNKYDHFPSYIFRGIKADIYEGGHHVPFIARWPGTIKAGTSTATTVCLTDFFATCADILSATIKDNEAEDSYSLLPIFKGQPAKYKRAYTIHHSSGGFFAIRQAEWKLIMSAGSGGWSSPKPGKEEQGLPVIQLYNLKLDIKEEKNVQANYPGIVKKLKQQLIDCIKNGRSTTGKTQENDGSFLPNTIKWITD